MRKKDCSKCYVTIEKKSFLVSGIFTLIFIQIIMMIPILNVILLSEMSDTKHFWKGTLYELKKEEIKVKQVR